MCGGFVRDPTGNHRGREDETGERLSLQIVCLVVGAQTFGASVVEIWASFFGDWAEARLVVDSCVKEKLYGTWWEFTRRKKTLKTA